MSAIARMQIFLRVAELASFTQAAQSLGLPKASASTAVQQLEAELGTRLLHRTTRRVQLTQDGQAFYERSRDLLVDLDELTTMFRQAEGQALRGRVRIDMSTGLARRIVVPRLPELLAAHPELEVELSSTERRVDLVREGFDCVLRVGAVGDQALIARPLGRLALLNCASPAYLAAHGVPRTLADLAAHRLVRYVGTLGARSAGFDHAGGSLAMAGAVTVNSAEAYEAACVAGLGIVQAPALAMRPLIEAGRVVEILPDHRAPAMPLNLVYANRRNLSRRVRVVMDWLAAVVAEALSNESSIEPQSHPS